MLELCDEEGIAIDAYGSQKGNPFVMVPEADPHVRAIAKRLGRKPAQVLLRWALQHNLAVTVSAQSKEEIFESVELDFDISDDWMQRLSSIQWLAHSPINKPIVYDLHGVANS